MNLSTGQTVLVSYAMLRMKIRGIKCLLQTEYLRFASDLPQYSGGMLKGSLIQLTMLQEEWACRPSPTVMDDPRAHAFFGRMKKIGQCPAALDDEGGEEPCATEESEATFISLAHPS